jgi:hypothetical protein
VIQLGISDGTSTEVTGGALAEHDRVIVGLSGPQEAPGRRPTGPRL